MDIMMVGIKKEILGRNKMPLDYIEKVNITTVAERIVELFEEKPPHWKSQYEWKEKVHEVVTILVDEFYPE